MNNERRENKAREVERQTKRTRQIPKEKAYLEDKCAPKENKVKEQNKPKKTTVPSTVKIFLESLILAQDKRWRRA